VHSARSVNSGAAICYPGLRIRDDGHVHNLTVSGGSSTVGTFHINAYSADGTLLGAPFQIDVKPRLNKTVRFSTITDSAAGLLMPPVNIPTLDSLQTELDRIFLRQANVQFNVTSGGNFDNHYDTDGDKKLHYDVN